MLEVSSRKIIYIAVIITFIFPPSVLFAKFFVEGGIGLNIVKNYKEQEAKYPNFSNINAAGYNLGLGYEAKSNLSFVLGINLSNFTETDKKFNNKDYSFTYSNLRLALLTKYSAKIIGNLYGNLGAGIAYNKDKLQYKSWWQENFSGSPINQYNKDKKYNEYASGIALLGLEYKISSAVSLLGNYEYNIALTKYNNNTISGHYFSLMAKLYLF